ncbi:hypothetical protein ABTQ33_12345 [Paucilactobacillus suebicus]|uniref:Uncharacterized protein n=1 Tax=Paucilactobacillus suebicus DSM 5007 = KCTC 3549 TaxID=1423807 RepID=A0A0R1VX83_9LACO|nr:hypothetical protein [Paucilactobacillus suebicus]KRM10289.1 hypothetical protein FD16_GL001220 [Paucilactobacillus suebicus DSM 5007 = KCTC 3549]
MDLTSYVVPLILIVWIVWRQLNPRMVSKKLRTYVIIMIIGIVLVVGGVDKHKVSFTPNGLLILTITFIISAVLFGILRAISYQLWVDDTGLVMRKGTALTIGLWITSAVIHLIGDHFVPGGEALMVFYIGLSLMVQREWVFHRARSKFPDEIKSNIIKMAEDKD